LSWSGRKKRWRTIEHAPSNIDVASNSQQRQLEEVKQQQLDADVGKDKRKW